jgi:hypothetical protein
MCTVQLEEPMLAEVCRTPDIVVTYWVFLNVSLYEIYSSATWNTETYRLRELLFAGHA